MYNRFFEHAPCNTPSDCLSLAQDVASVAGQTSTSEGARTGFVQPLSKPSLMSQLGLGRVETPGQLA